MSRHHTALERLGEAIVHGRRRPGETFTTGDVERELGVSRSVARESVRVLESLGLVTTSPRVGCTVAPSQQWNILSPQIIGWRMTGPDRHLQLEALTELRAGVEPVAAALAARRATWDDCHVLESTAQQMAELGAAGRGNDHEFLAADLVFHTRLLSASGNPAYAALAPTIAACLTGRNEAGMTPACPAPENLQRHVLLSQAIRERQEAEAERLARELVSRVAREVADARD